jgi:hypothetical protein
LAPLDSLYGGQRSFYYRAGWQLKFAWLPHRCINSDHIIWLKFAYIGTAIWTGPGEDIVECNWLTKEEYLFNRLKGIIK